MKKIMGVSVFAIMAALPMIAGAAKQSAPITLQGNNGSISPSTQVATTSYVQGAYNALATEHNKVVSDITLTGTYDNTDHISAGASVAENLESLNSAIKSAVGSSSDTYVTKGSATATAVEGKTLQYIPLEDGVTPGTNVGVNLGKLDNAIYTNASEIGTFDVNGNQNYVSDANTIQQNLQSLDGQLKLNTNTIGVYDAGKSHSKIENTDIFSNLHILDAQVAANSNAITINTSAIGTVSELSSAGGLIPSTTTNLVDAVKAINTSLNNANTGATIIEGTYVDEGDTVAQAIDKLDGAIEVNANAISDINTNKIGNTAMGTTNTTVTGAIKEMHDQTLTVYTTWGTDNTQNVNLFPQQ
jgi:hypothetical protein